MLATLGAGVSVIYLVNYLVTKSDRKREIPVDRAPEFEIYANPLDVESRAVWMAALDTKHLAFTEVHAPLPHEAATIQAHGKEKTAMFHSSDLSNEELLTVYANAKSLTPNFSLPVVVKDNRAVSGSTEVAAYLQDVFRGLKPNIIPHGLTAEYKAKLDAVDELHSNCLALVRNQDPSQDSDLTEKIYSNWLTIWNMADEESAFLDGHHCSLVDYKLAAVYQSMGAALEAWRNTPIIPTDKSKHVWLGRADKWLHEIEHKPSYRLTSSSVRAYKENYRRDAYPREASQVAL